MNMRSPYGIHVPTTAVGNRVRERVRKNIGENSVEWLEELAQQSIHLIRVCIDPKLVSSAKLQEIQRNADHILQFLISQTQAAKFKIETKMDQLTTAMAELQPRMAEFSGDKEYEEAVGVWVPAVQAATKAVQSWSKFFTNLLSKIMDRLSKIVEAIKRAIKEAFDKIKQLVEWFSTQVSVCKKKMQELFG